MGAQARWWLLAAVMLIAPLARADPAVIDDRTLSWRARHRPAVREGNSLLRQVWKSCHARLYPGLTGQLRFTSARIRVVEDAGYGFELELGMPRADALTQGTATLRQHQVMKRCAEGSFARHGVVRSQIDPRYWVDGYVGEWTVAAPPWLYDVGTTDAYGLLVRDPAMRAIAHHGRQAHLHCRARGDYRVRVWTSRDGAARKVEVLVPVKGLANDHGPCIQVELEARLRFPPASRQAELMVTVP